ncbi:MAG: ribonuclease D [Dehalococcoidia bacterium]|nr:ribonuclease D [Dehalococcoidia bacterium]
MLITDSRDLAAFCKRLEGAPYVAVDTEFLREKTYWPKLCLVQIAYDDEAAAIDPLARDIDLDPMFNLMDDESVLKVFHSASQDMEVFFSIAGRVPEPVFDTQVAAMVAGYGEQVGYATLASQIAGVTLDKSSQLTDWSLRPLSDRQIQYALGDVTHLCTIYEDLEDRLEESGRTSWVSEEMAALTDISSYRADPREAYRRVRIRRPNRKALAVLREVVAWREETAQRRNLPRNWVIRDDALVEIATHAPKNVADLGRVRGLRGNAAKGRDGEALLQAVQRALDMRQSEWPEIPPRRPPIRGHEALVALLQTLLRLRCEDHDVAPKLVATRDELDRIATTNDENLRPLQGWRYELFGKDALDLKAGRLGLTGDHGQVRVLRPDQSD